MSPCRPIGAPAVPEPPPVTHALEVVETRAIVVSDGTDVIPLAQLVHRLTPLTLAGHHLLSERRWPGSRHEQPGVVVVGPAGVFVVAGRTWTDVSLTEDQVWHGEVDATAQVMNLADLAYRAESVFAEVGLAPGEVRPLVVLEGHGGVDERIGPVRIVGERAVVRHVAAYGTRLTTAQVDVVLAHARQRLGVVDVELEPGTQAAWDTATNGPPPLVERVGGRLVAPPPSGPFEEWMSFLHPTQAKAVRRSFGGPSRIRGAAGTGKTVVALHRAAYLARTRPGTVLVTTFVRILPEVLRDQLARMAPDVVDRVEITRVPDWARAVLAERGVPVPIEPRAVAEAFDTGWRSLPPASWLARTDRDRAYWKDEISHVIKGRALTSFDEYAQLPRTGRRQRLDLEQRRQVWALYVAYQDALAARGTHDFDDVVLLAEAELRREPLTGRYSSVIVDEVQDLSVVTVRMLHALVGDAPDGLTVVGDGQQSLYPGGHPLAEAGVSVAGRGVVLDVNFRNTAQILAYAQKMVDGDEFDDIDGGVVAGDRARSVPRSGPEPVTQRFRSAAARDRAMVDRLTTVVTGLGTAPGAIGVLCTNRRAAESIGALLRSVDVPAVLFEEHDGTPVDAVKVGTIKRAKGLEFAQVLLPDVAAELFGAVPTEPVERERWELARRELYVAMTRAREGLWVAVL